MVSIQLVFWKHSGRAKVALFPILAIRTLSAKRRARAFAYSRHDENFLRIGIFNFASGGVTADIDVPATGIKRIKNQAGFARHRFRDRKLRGC